MKRGRSRRDYPYYPVESRRKRKTKGTLIVVLLIIGAIIYIYFSKVGSFNSILPGFFNSTTSIMAPDTVIQACNQQVTSCGGVIKAKYESSLVILKTVEVNTTLGANEFLKTWGPASQVSSISYYDAKLPVVLVATRMDNSDGSKTPHVFVCSNGTLEAKSISGLC